MINLYVLKNTPQNLLIVSLKLNLIQNGFLKQMEQNKHLILNGQQYETQIYFWRLKTTMPFYFRCNSFYLTYAWAKSFLVGRLSLCFLKNQILVLLLIHKEY